MFYKISQIEVENIHPKRIKILKDGEILDQNNFVVYWMDRDQRLKDNWALYYSQQIALKLKKPLIVVFLFSKDFIYGTLRHYDFLFNGLIKLKKELELKNISFLILLVKNFDEFITFLNKIKTLILITDFNPLKPKRKIIERILKETKLPFIEIDAHNIVPCWYASDKLEYGAYTLRPKILSKLNEFLVPIPDIVKHPFINNFFNLEKLSNFDFDKIINFLSIDKSVNSIEWLKPGEDEAKRVLENFLKFKLNNYHLLRNDPSQDVLSNLSPYLHFGQISAQKVALEVKKCEASIEAKKSFLEELIIRRELSDNFCFYNQNYDSPLGFPRWAIETLEKHSKDKREYIYSFDEFEKAKTHDPLWNAAQIEMVIRGKMHGYMRIYWAKKILEWSENYKQAYEIAIYLNDKYELDGNDPNGFVGVGWSIGGIHDRPWQERSIFGKIRYMNYSGCQKKFNVHAYIDKIKNLNQNLDNNDSL